MKSYRQQKESADSVVPRNNYSAKKVKSTFPEKFNLILIGIMGLDFTAEFEYVTCLVCTCVDKLITYNTSDTIAQLPNIFSVTISIQHLSELLYEQLNTQGITLTDLYNIHKSIDTWTSVRGNAYPFIYVNLHDPVNEETKEPLKVYHSLSEHLDPVSLARIQRRGEGYRDKLVERNQAKIELLETKNKCIVESTFRLYKLNKPLYSIYTFDMYGNIAIHNIKAKV